MAWPDRLIVVAGTGTSVGKTWWTCAVASELRARGARVAARKPVQSFDLDDPEDRRDAAVLAAATGEDPADVCPPHRSYPLPMAPPMAADALGRPRIKLADLLDLSWPRYEIDIGFVETAGGLRSPIGHDGDGLSLIERLKPDLVVVVADAGLGTINLVRLTTDALGEHTVVVALNRYDDANELHRRNRRWLDDLDGHDVVVDAHELAARLIR